MTVDRGQKLTTFTITNQKGGVGKTTTAVNLAAAWHAMQKRVCLVDSDPQGNASSGCGISRLAQRPSLKELLLGETPIDEVICKSEAGFDIIPSQQSLTVAEVRLLQMTRREHRLYNILQQLEGRYDYVIIDSPPSLNILTVNALVAAQFVIIPVQCEYYALEGLTDLLKNIEHLRRALSCSLSVAGILRTMYDGRNRLTHEVSAELQKHFSEQVYHTVIPRNIRLAEAPSYGKPAICYDAKAQGSIAYLALASEILRKLETETRLAAETVATI
jgi:chromosome partitioning protein